MHAARRTPAFPRIAVTNRIYMVKCRSGTPYDTVTPADFNTPASHILTPAARASHLSPFRMRAERDFSTRIRNFYTTSAAHTQNQLPGAPPQLQIILPSGKTTMFSFTALGSVIEQIRLTTLHNGTTDVENGFIGIATRSDEDPAHPALRKLNSTRLDQVITLPLRVLRIVAQVAVQQHQEIPTAAALVAAGATQAEADTARLMATAVRKHTPNQYKDIMVGHQHPRWHDRPGSILTTTRV
ncbi:hypothetical protein DMC30DRAFT_396137 [Rhodotorula diobovata]|uniref:Uncharacterized protein n=1 Tax=Rhodotorula diobovata TaxID=5288 RepID=A0A5C5FW71_9BASI|nr:hypothetical protein DMC30DRAFT_396137 [Rhodotorula diobovata]